MSLLSGTVSAFRFIVLGTWHGEADAALAREIDRFRPFEDGSEDSRHGWADWRNPLMPVDPNFLSADGVATFALRIDKRKIPSAVLKAHVDQRIQKLLAEKDLAFLGKEARLSIMDEVKSELLPKVMPSMKVITCQWRFKDGIFLADGTSDVLASQVVKTFGIELQPLCPLVLAGRVIPTLNPEALVGIEPLDLRIDEVMA